MTPKNEKKRRGEEVPRGEGEMGKKWRRGKEGEEKGLEGVKAEKRAALLPTVAVTLSTCAENSMHANTTNVMRSN